MRRSLKNEITVEELQKLYIKDNLSTQDIATLYGYNANTVRVLLKEYKIVKDKKSIYASRDHNTKNTYKQKYGVENNSQLPEWKEKVKATCMKKYGVSNVSQIKAVKDKVKNTTKQRYGVDNISQLPTNKMKATESLKQTCIKRYGVPYYTLKPECYTKCNNSISRLNKWWRDKIQALGYTITLECRVDDRLFDLRLENTKYLIEINPTTCHNSYQSITKDTNKAKSKDYHYQKSKLATEKGYHCIHIWNWDDKEKILSLFYKKTKIFARNTQIKVLSIKEANTFNDLYHLQNTCKGQKICLGLYYQSKLVSLMSFGKPRYNKNYQWELLRYTTHPEYMVIGGAEKLFKHFIEEFSPENILTYCDYSKFSGQVYQKLGFSKLRHNRPSCHWSKGKQHITQSQLSKYGFDKLLGNIYGRYGKGLNNQELMINHGFLPVYDCGQLVFEWRH